MFDGDSSFGNDSKKNRALRGTRWVAKGHCIETDGCDVTRATGSLLHKK